MSPTTPPTAPLMMAVLLELLLGARVAAKVAVVVSVLVVAENDTKGVGPSVIVTGTLIVMTEVIVVTIASELLTSSGAAVANGLFTFPT